MFDIRVLKSTLKSIVTPSSFTSSSHYMLFPFKLKAIFCVCVLLPIAIAWNFSGFSCILFDENHEISDLLSSSRDFVTVAKEVTDLKEYYPLRNYTSHSF